ncbi:MAG TPA: acyltransferase, partial [Acidimicrobiaceae bacterium]|nr:acyltransferase [Acidimicrobiaceae bacterium]
MFGLRSRCRSVVGRLIRAVSRRVNSAASIGPNDHGARPYKQFGNGSIISWPTGNMYGERWISIGENTMIASHVTLSAGMVPDQQMMTDPVVIIGDRCLIGRGSSIVGH